LFILAYHAVTWIDNKPGLILLVNPDI